MQNRTIKKSLVVGILFLFIGTGFNPVIGRNFEKVEDVSSLIFYTFGRSGTKKCKVELETSAIEDISFMFEDLKNKLTCDPTSDQTFELKNDFVDLLDRNGLIPVGLSRDYVFSLLNPSWLKWINGDSPFIKNKFFSSIGSRLKNNFVPGSFSNTGTAFFCSMAGGGFGLMFPPVMIPRPRIATVWSSFLNADTIAANLYTGNGFAASGSQFGVALGFLGVGLSFAIPGQPAYFGFGGYSLFTMVGADEITTYPLNRAPVVSEETPSDGSRDVSLSLSELSFRISDADGDRMSYWVTTDPDIGSDEGHFKMDGRYSVSVSGLEYDKSYRWTVRVSDGESEVEKNFGFFSVEGPPFDPFDGGWQYRKKITVDHSQVAGDLSDFPVLVNVVDSDLRDKAQIDGDDILFMDGPGVASRLFHEIERFDGYSGTLAAWVCIPGLSGSSDTEFYMYYGNPGCSNQEFPENVWDSDFKLVYHLDETSGHHQDSTVNNKDTTFERITMQGSAIGIIDGADKFEESNDDYATCPDIGDLNTYTIEEWIKVESFTYVMDTIGKEKEITMFIHHTSKYIGFNVGDGSNWGNMARTDDNFVDLNTWYYLVGTSDGSNLRLYINVNLEDTSDANAYNFDSIFYLGDRDAGDRYPMDGIIDEVRISNVVRSDDWIITSYNTMNDPSSFLSFGPEESGP